MLSKCVLIENGGNIKLPSHLRLALTSPEATSVPSLLGILLENSSASIGDVSICFCFMYVETCYMHCSLSLPLHSVSGDCSVWRIQLCSFEWPQRTPAWDSAAISLTKGPC